jgi:hypothetical protein
MILHVLIAMLLAGSTVIGKRTWLTCKQTTVSSQSKSVAADGL